MSENVIDTAIEMLTKSKLTDYAIAKGTGITATSIGNWRKGKMRPMVANAKAIIEYLTNGATPTDNNSINPTNTQAMEVGLALDYIATLKEQLATMKEQLKEKDALIRQLTQKGGDEALSRGVGAVKERQDELTNKP